MGAVHAQLRKNKWYSSQNIFILTPKNNRLFNLLTVSSINKILDDYGGYSSYPTLTSLRKHIIKLPTKDGNIDFDFMESIINDIENECIKQLEHYLNSMGINDCHLTMEEKNAILDLQKVEWKQFKMDNLFERIKTNKLPYKAKELPKEPKDKYVLPCLTSSFMNQGLNYYAPREEATILKNVISLPSNSDVYRAYFQSNEFTVLSDSYAIEWIYDNKKLTNNQYLFTVSCINKVTDLPIYSYKNKLGGWNVVREKLIKLPVKNNKPDYEFMENFINGIKKLLLEDLVIWIDKP